MRKLLAMIMTIGVLAALAVVILDNSEPEQKITYTYPASGTYTSYEVTHSSKGYSNTIYESIEYGLTDAEKQAMFEQYAEQKNVIAEYQEARAIAEADKSESFEEAEEQRIAEYCEEEGIESCYNIKYTCDTEYECHLVTIECEDYDYNPWKEINSGSKYACKEWRVSVDTADFDIREVDERYWQNYGYMW